MFRLIIVKKIFDKIFWVHLRMVLKLIETALRLILLSILTKLIT